MMSEIIEPETIEPNSMNQQNDLSKTHEDEQQQHHDLNEEIDDEKDEEVKIQDLSDGHLLPKLNNDKSGELQYNEYDNESYNELQPFNSTSSSPSLLTELSSISRGKDIYCWVCHHDGIDVSCKACPRGFHYKCIPSKASQSSSVHGSSSQGPTHWICSECKSILSAEEISPQRQTLVSKLLVDELGLLLEFALETIKASADPSFHKPVSQIVYPDYYKMIQHPMDISTIHKNIKARQYGCTQAFLADIKWIVHNCIIYNDNSHPLTINAKYLSRVAKNETAEIEICPNCFKNFYTTKEQSTWFAEPCSSPHTLVYARVKGYPIWPAKAVRLGQHNDVDCRFFGTHDRSWVPLDSCWLLSKDHPGNKPSKANKTKFEGAMKELALHIERLNEKCPGVFKYAPSKTPFDPTKMCLTDYNGFQFDSNDVNQKQNNDSQNKESNKSLDLDQMGSHSSDNELSIDLSDSQSTHQLLNISKTSSNTKSRTARVGKRKVAEALFGSSGSASKTLKANDHQSSRLSCSSSSFNDNSNEQGYVSSNEIESLKKQIAFYKMEKEKAVQEERRKSEYEKKLMTAQYEQEIRKLNSSIEETKRKQWCAQCLKEAKLFCCYDTWYCNYPCQKEHWKTHVNSCHQIQKKDCPSAHATP